MATSIAQIDEDALPTFRKAASILGIPYYKIQRAVKASFIPTCSLLNSRNALGHPTCNVCWRGLSPRGECGVTIEPIETFFDVRAQARKAVEFHMQLERTR